MASEQGLCQAEEDWLPRPGCKVETLWQLLHTVYSVPVHLSGLDRGILTPLAPFPPGPMAQPLMPSVIHSIVTVPPDVFFLGLKGVLLTLFTLIYYHPYFSGSHNWCQGCLCLETSQFHSLVRRRGCSPGNPGAPSQKWQLPPVLAASMPWRKDHLSQDAFATLILTDPGTCGVGSRAPMLPEGREQGKRQNNGP